MNFTTFVVSNSMDALALAYDELNIDRDRSLAASVLVLLQELTAQYPPEMFTDDELTLIADWITHDKARRAGRGMFAIPEVPVMLTEDAPKTEAVEPEAVMA
jgi:hypothetical protein